MSLRRHFGRSLMLLALALGLNVLFYFGYTHGHHAVHSSRVNYPHIPPHGSHRPVSRNSRASHGQGSLDAAHHDSGDTQITPKLKPIDFPAYLAAASPALPLPEAIAEPLAEVNVLALGTAPRAPSLGRAPPTL